MTTPNDLPNYRQPTPEAPQTEVSETPASNGGKPVYQSKTMWTGLMLAISAAYSPKLSQILNVNPELLYQLELAVGGGLVMVFRWLTTTPIAKKDK